MHVHPYPRPSQLTRAIQRCPPPVPSPQNCALPASELEAGFRSTVTTNSIRRHEQTAEGHNRNHFLCSSGRFSSLFSYNITPWVRLGGRRPFQRTRTAAVPVSNHCHSRLANVSGPRANPSAQRVACFLLAVAFFLDDNSPRVDP